MESHVDWIISLYFQHFVLSKDTRKLPMYLLRRQMYSLGGVAGHKVSLECGKARRSEEEGEKRA
jgi:hypothetical protein